LRISEVISSIEYRVKNAVQPYILIELTMLKLLEIDTTVTIQSILDNFSKNSNKNASVSNIDNKINKTSLDNSTNSTNDTAKNRVKTTPPKQKSHENITIDTIKTKWQQFLKELSSEKPSVSNALEHCEIGKLIGNRLEIKMVNGNNFNLRTLEKNKLMIEKLLDKVYNFPIKTVYLMSKSEDTKKNQELNKKELERTNQTTAKIIELFEGEIIT
jgi:hypothetical protein